MSPAPGWPVSLAHGDVVVRPLRARDAVAWSEVRVRNERWLSPWEGRNPALPAGSWSERHSPAVYAAMLRGQRKEARAGRVLPFGVVAGGALAGQVTVSNVVRGAFHSASVGYWVDERVAGRGVLPTALGLVVDHLFGPVGLHRVEAAVRPENARSRRVVDKLGFRQCGQARRYLFIDEDWRDHLLFELLAEDVPGGALARYLAA